MASTPEVIQEIPTEAPKLSQGSRLYEDQDFRHLYEEEYARHQETKRQLQIALDRIEYVDRQQ